MRTVKPRNSVQSLMSGFSIIEALVASVIVMGAFLGLASAMIQTQQLGPKSKILNTMLHLESEIASQLQNPDAFVAVHSVNDLQTLILKDSSSNILAKATPGSISYFDISGQPCPSKNTSTCFISTELGFDCTTVIGSYNFCQAAYSIQADVNDFKVSVHPRGVAKKIGAAFSKVSGDYSTPISFNMYNGSKGQEGCDSSSDAFLVTGYERDTGKVFCAKRPQQACPAGSIAVGIKFVPSGSLPITGSFELDCRAMKKVGCDTGYVLYNFDPSKLYPTSSVTGQCVFAGADDVTHSVTKSQLNYVAGTLCPPDYDVDSTSVSCNVGSPACVSCQIGAHNVCTNYKTVTPAPPALPYQACTSWSPVPDYGTVCSQFSPVQKSVSGRMGSCQTQFTSYSGGYCIDGTPMPSQDIQVTLTGVKCNLSPSKPKFTPVKEVP
jgi:hypothetical protein